MVPRGIRLFRTEPDLVIGISAPLFEIEGAFIFYLTITVSKFVLEGELAYTEFSPYEHAGDTAVDAGSRTI